MFFCCPVAMVLDVLQVEAMLCVGEVAVTTDISIDNIPYTAVSSSFPPKWLKTALQIKRINDTTMPPDNTLKTIASRIATARGKRQRHTRSVDEKRTPTMTLTIEVDGYQLKVANKKSPILIQKSEDNIRWLYDRLRNERDSFVLAHPESGDDDDGDDEETDGSLPACPPGVIATPSRRIHGQAEMEDSPNKVDFNAMYLETHHDPTRADRVWWSNAKNAYIGSYVPPPGPDNVKAKGRREIFIVQRKKGHNFDEYCEERSVQRRRACQFAASGIKVA